MHKCFIRVLLLTFPGYRGLNTTVYIDPINIIKLHEITFILGPGVDIWGLHICRLDHKTKIFSEKNQPNFMANSCLDIYKSVLCLFWKSSFTKINNYVFSRIYHSAKHDDQVGGQTDYVIINASNKM